jgi:limonene-1,2-epoxide hydrolase
MNPEDVVRAELDAWSRLDINEIMSYFSDDAIWDNVPILAVSGREEIRKAVRWALERTTHADIEIINLVATGNVVLTERVDHLVVNNNSLDVRVMGAFDVFGSKITSWRDYFDVHAKTVREHRDGGKAT